MNDLVFAVGTLLTSGGFLLLLCLFSFVLGRLSGIGAGRRQQARDAVEDTYLRATFVARVAEVARGRVVPAQREPSS